MNFDVLLPMTLLVCIAYVIKVLVNATSRKQIINAGGSAELVNSILRAEAQYQRTSSLRWGIVLLSVGLGFGIIQWLNWKEITPGVIALLTCATAAGNLIFFAVSRILKPE